MLARLLLPNEMAVDAAVPLALRPTVIFVGYGTSESFAAESIVASAGEALSPTGSLMFNDADEHAANVGATKASAVHEKEVRRSIAEV